MFPYVKAQVINLFGAAAREVLFEYRTLAAKKKIMMRLITKQCAAPMAQYLLDPKLMTTIPTYRIISLFSRLPRQL